MSTVGDVVFCVDCDRARSAQLSSAGEPPATLEPPPRRGATKKDSNGDALCTACLDARLLRRRAEFVLQQGKAPSADSLPASSPSPAPADTSARNFSRMRIERIRPPVEAAAQNGKQQNGKQQNGKKEHAIAKTMVEARVVALRVSDLRIPQANDRHLERRFLQMAADLGFVRAQELLKDLKARVRAVTG